MIRRLINASQLNRPCEVSFFNSVILLGLLVPNDHCFFELSFCIFSCDWFWNIYYVSLMHIRSLKYHDIFTVACAGVWIFTCTNNTTTFTFIVIIGRYGFDITLSFPSHCNEFVLVGSIVFGNLLLSMFLSIPSMIIIHSFSIMVAV